MVNTTAVQGAISLQYKFSDLDRQVSLHSLYDAKTLRKEDGRASFDDVAITNDEHELIHPFYKEFHAELAPVLSTILLRGINNDMITNTPETVVSPNISWNIADGTKLDEASGEMVADEYFESHHLFQNNMITNLDIQIEAGYKYYALYKWFLSINTLPALAQKYHTFYTEAMDKIRSLVRHNNDKNTRASIPYKMF
jgi:hypothetical protein